MEQLTSADAAFLTMETGNVTMHTGALTIIDPSDAPDFGFEALRRLLDERIDQAERFTKKLRWVPGGIDWPYLVEDPDFDIDHHLRRIGVARPGGVKELCDLVGHLMAIPLDRERPLWEMWYVDGLEDGRVAMIAKTHHCLVDGVSGSALGAILADLEPSPPPRKPNLQNRRRTVIVKSDLELLTDGVLKALSGPRAMVNTVRAAAVNAPAIIRYMRGEDAPRPVKGVPKLPWNADLSPRRGFAFARLPLEDVKAVKKHFGVKLNDVVIAVCAGALRRYVEQIGELPEEPLVCAMPISIRAEGDETLGNQITNVTVPMATDLDDPAQRLQAIHDATMHAKEMTKAMGVADIIAESEALPATLITLAMRAAESLGDGLSIPANTIVSNVPGPPIQLYSAGAKLEANYPVAPLMPGMGLNLTVMSYMDAIDFGVSVDPELIEDPWAIANGFEVALDELKRAAGLTRTAAALSEAAGGSDTADVAESSRKGERGGAKAGAKAKRSVKAKAGPEPTSAAAPVPPEVSAQPAAGDTPGSEPA